MKQPQVKEHFAKQADEYESLMVRLVPYYLEQHRIIRELLPDDDKEYRVLDLGCGNGVLSEVVFSKLPRAYIVAFDLTENMLQAYEKKLKKHAGAFELKAGDFLYGPNWQRLRRGCGRPYFAPFNLERKRRVLQNHIPFHE